MNNKKHILIVDDSELNRSLLSDILGDGYRILEASNGEEAISIISQYQNKIDLVLLDIVMPEMDGFEVLAMMNKAHWVDFIPVIMISAETSISHVEHAYDLGAVDYINRPFEPKIVLQRVKNTLALYERQRRLQGLVYDQIYDKEKNNQLMIEILSHIVEFRNGESGLHVLHIRIITEMLLNALKQRTQQYPMTVKDINMIVNASALHDIGKIAIDEKILNKPGRLTPEEFEIMKTHSSKGAEMLENLPEGQGEQLVQYAHEICKWHHERWDGRGYPDGLKGDEIPISAQVVSLADVYDALTSQRVYKPAYSHKQALEMIMNGECGQFNPILLECLNDISTSLQNELKLRSLKGMTSQEVEKMTQSIIHNSEYKVSDRTLYLLDAHRHKHDFYFLNTREIYFEYEYNTNILTVSKWASMLLGLSETTIDPLNNSHLLSIFREDDIHQLLIKIQEMKQTDAKLVYPIQINCHGQLRNYICIGKLFKDDETQEILGICGKLMDKSFHFTQSLVEEEYTDHLYNAVTQVEKYLMYHPENNYVLTTIQANQLEQLSQTQKNQIIDTIMQQLTSYAHKDSVVAQVNHDLFMVFEKCDCLDESWVVLINRLHNEGISIQYGSTSFPNDGIDCENLFMKAIVNMSYLKNE